MQDDVLAEKSFIIVGLVRRVDLKYGVGALRKSKLPSKGFNGKQALYSSVLARNMSVACSRGFSRNANYIVI